MSSGDTLADNLEWSPLIRVHRTVAIINQHIRIIRFTVRVIIPAAIDPSVGPAGRFAPG